MTQYNYDPLGNMTQAVKCSGSTVSNCGTSQGRTFGYDALSRLTSANNPESGTVTYSYVNSGGAAAPAVQKRTDAEGRVTNYSYDALKRLTGVSYSDGTPSLSYAFDNVGNLTSATSGTGTGAVVTSYPSYDAAHRPLSSTLTLGGQSYGFNYTYDLAGILLTETYPSGRVMTATIDTGMRAYSIKGVKNSNTTNYVQAAGHYPQGSGAWWQYGNNVWPAEQYNQTLAPTLFYSTKANDPNQSLFSQKNTWNTNGTVQSALECYGAAGSMTCTTANYRIINMMR